MLSLPISLTKELQAKLLKGPFPDPGSHHRQPHCLAIRETIEGLADRALLLVCTATAKLEGRVGSVRQVRGSSGSPACPSPHLTPGVNALYPTAPLALGHLHLHLGLEVLGVVEAGRVRAAGLQAA